jgi:hypothetical protein
LWFLFSIIIYVIFLRLLFFFNRRRQQRALEVNQFLVPPQHRRIARNYLCSDRAILWSSILLASLLIFQEALFLSLQVVIYVCQHNPSSQPLLDVIQDISGIYRFLIWPLVSFA